ncbi:MAG TPA: hypothetical protein DCS30_20630 [Rhizobiales bacterium]|nr:hypothetical protein [Hyphomicrobiales bacterium]
MPTQPDALLYRSFDEYRREPEDRFDWYSIGHFGTASFGNFDQALEEAKTKVSRLANIIMEWLSCPQSCYWNTEQRKFISHSPHFPSHRW